MGTVEIILRNQVIEDIFYNIFVVNKMQRKGEQKGLFGG